LSRRNARRLPPSPLTQQPIARSRGQRAESSRWAVDRWHSEAALALQRQSEVLGLLADHRDPAIDLDCRSLTPGWRNRDVFDTRASDVAAAPLAQ
jgi:hypothetical protein